MGILSFFICPRSSIPTLLISYTECLMVLLASNYVDGHWLHLLVVHMFPQSTCIERCMLTLGAQVWFFSAVILHVPCKIICRVSCVLTLVAFMGLFSTTVFHQPINPSTHFVQFIKSQEETFKDYRIMDPKIPGQIILGQMILGLRILELRILCTD